jgi:hypothetical protein
MHVVACNAARGIYFYNLALKQSMQLLNHSASLRAAEATSKY